MNYTRIYILICVISLAMMLPSCIQDRSILNTLSGIGCSGLAASIMAIYIESNAKKIEKQKLAKARNLYFKKLNDQLNMLMGRIIWFNERLSDHEFNWDLPPQEYSSFKYMLSANSLYPETSSFSFDDAKTKLTEIGEKFNLEAQKKMSPEDLLIVQKMFIILATSASFLLNEANTIKDNKLDLNISEYADIETIDGILFNISLAIGIMSIPGKNYSAAIDAVLSASSTLRELGQYTDSIRGSLHGSIYINEL